MENRLLYCERCDQFVETVIQKKSETLKVKGIDITLDVDTCICRCCGEAVFAPDVDEISLKQFYTEYRKRMGLLQPEEIRKIRGQYGLSQEAFARVLGMGAKTIARYENGSLQDEAQNNLILLMRDRENMQKLVELHPERLTENERAAIMNQLDDDTSVSFSDISDNIVSIFDYSSQKGSGTSYANELYKSDSNLCAV